MSSIGGDGGGGVGHLCCASIYLLSWYKSINTDAEGAVVRQFGAHLRRFRQRERRACPRCITRWNCERPRRNGFKDIELRCRKLLRSVSAAGLQLPRRLLTCSRYILNLSYTRTKPLRSVSAAGLLLPRRLLTCSRYVSPEI